MLALIELTQGLLSGREVHVIQDENAPISGMLNDFVLVNKTNGERRFLVGYRHDGEGNLIATLDADNHPYQFEYIADSQMVRHTDRNGLSFYYRYQRHSDGWTGSSTPGVMAGCSITVFIMIGSIRKPKSPIHWATPPCCATTNGGCRLPASRH